MQLTPCMMLTIMHERCAFHLRRIRNTALLESHPPSGVHEVLKRAPQTIERSQGGILEVAVVRTPHVSWNTLESLITTIETASVYC